MTRSGIRKYIEKKTSLTIYEDKLGTYLVKITGVELKESQTRDVSLILHTIGDFERLGDHAVNIADLAAELNEKKVKFSKDAVRELKTLHSAINEYQPYNGGLDRKRPCKGI